DANLITRTASLVIGTHTRALFFRGGLAIARLGWRPVDAALPARFLLRLLVHPALEVSCFLRLARGGFFRVRLVPFALFLALGFPIPHRRSAARFLFGAVAGCRTQLPIVEVVVVEIRLAAYHVEDGESSGTRR